MPEMNRQWVLGNLHETIEHIETVIAEIKQGNEYAFGSWIEFIYRDLNRAWNGRFMSFDECDAADETLRQFPKDIDFT